jgi:hypothetical protein
MDTLMYGIAGHLGSETRQRLSDQVIDLAVMSRLVGYICLRQPADRHRASS